VALAARVGVAVKANNARTRTTMGREIRRVGIQLRNRAGWLPSRSCLPAVACLDTGLLFRVNVLAAVARPREIFLVGLEADAPVPWKARTRAASATPSRCRRDASLFDALVIGEPFLGWWYVFRALNSGA